MEAVLLVDVVIIHHNTPELTSRCIETLLQSSAAPITRIIVVDNASTDGSGEQLTAQFPSITVVNLEQPHSYAAACNIGAQQGNAPYLLLSNSDVEYSPDSIDRFVRYMDAHPAVAVCCPLQRYPDGRRQRSWGYFPGWSEIAALVTGIETFHNRRGHRNTVPRAVPYCDGAALFFRRVAYEQIGGMDERFWFFCEDADICYRLWQHGWQCHVLPSATIVHHRGATRQRSLEESIAFEQQNMAAKCLFVQLHRLPLWKYVPLGYAAAFQARQLADSIAALFGLQAKRSIQRRIRRACIDALLQHYAAN